MKVFKNYFYIFLGYLIINVLSIEILQKYKSIETNNPRIAFNASEFSEGKKMFFKLETDDCECDDYLYYKYYDNIDNIDYIDYYNNNSNYNNDKMYSVESYSKSTTEKNNKETITKSYEIKNKKKN